MHQSIIAFAIQYNWRLMLCNFTDKNDIKPENKQKIPFKKYKVARKKLTRYKHIFNFVWPNLQHA